jgi:hypothetical protein
MSLFTSTVAPPAGSVKRDPAYSCKLQAASCKLQAASCKLQAASCKLQAASESVWRPAPNAQAFSYGLWLAT